MTVNLTGRVESWKFRQLLRWSLWTRLWRRTTSDNVTRLDRCRNGDVGDVHSLGDCASDQSRLSSRTSSRRDWFGYWQRKTAHLGWPFKVSLTIYVCNLHSGTMHFIAPKYPLYLIPVWDCFHQMHNLICEKKTE